MKRRMKSSRGAGALQPAPNALAKALAKSLFRQRIVASKKLYKRQRNQALSQDREI